MMGSLQNLLAQEGKRRGTARLMPIVLAIVVTVASTALLGLSGWFLAAAALAGVAGPIAARSFNYMLPAAAIRLLAIARTGARYGERLSGHGVALAMMARVRGALYRSIAAMPPQRALAIGRGDAAARMVQDVGAIEAALIRRSSHWSAIAAVAVATMLALPAGWLAGTFAGLTLLGAIAAARYLSARLVAPEHSVQCESAALKQLLLGYADAAPELRCFALEGRAIASIDSAARSLDRAALVHANRLAVVDAVAPVAATCAAVGLLALAIPVGPSFAALAALAALAAGGELGGVVRSFAERATVEEAGRRLDEMLSTQAMPIVTIDLAPRPAITLSGRDPVECGAVVVLAGPSGSGKTTLIESLIGLRAPRAGIARIEGVDISLIPPATLRSTFAWLPQDAQLLSGTVRDNLALARPDGDDALLWQALEDVMIADRVRAMPHGLDSWIGENGEKLSGGERRRLALARAYCATAPWLLLDEPVEGLDRETAAAVLDRLGHRLAAGRQGAIIASHQPILLAHARTVAVLS
jgi:ATP-binding cassette subfamily C protein CydC